MTTEIILNLITLEQFQNYYASQTKQVDTDDLDDVNKAIQDASLDIENFLIEKSLETGNNFLTDWENDTITAMDKRRVQQAMLILVAHYFENGRDVKNGGISFSFAGKNISSSRGDDNSISSQIWNILSRTKYVNTLQVVNTMTTAITDEASSQQCLLVKDCGKNLFAEKLTIKNVILVQEDLELPLETEHQFYFATKYTDLNGLVHYFGVLTLRNFETGEILFSQFILDSTYQSNNKLLTIHNHSNINIENIEAEIDSINNDLDIINSQIIVIEAELNEQSIRLDDVETLNSNQQNEIDNLMASVALLIADAGKGGTAISTSQNTTGAITLTTTQQKISNQLVDVESNTELLDYLGTGNWEQKKAGVMTFIEMGTINNTGGAQITARLKLELRDAAGTTILKAFEKDFTIAGNATSDLYISVDWNETTIIPRTYTLFIGIVSGATTLTLTQAKTMTMMTSTGLASTITTDQINNLSTLAGTLLTDALNGVQTRLQKLEGADVLLLQLNGGYDFSPRTFTESIANFESLVIKSDFNNENKEYDTSTPATWRTLKLIDNFNNQLVERHYRFKPDGINLTWNRFQNDLGVDTGFQRELVKFLFGTSTTESFSDETTLQGVIYFYGRKRKP